MENKEIVRILADARFKMRSDTLKNWAEKNPILLVGEPGAVIGVNAIGDGLESSNERVKIGDGITPWNNLSWWEGVKGEDGKDYVLTEADKEEIAEEVKELIDLPDGGDVDLTDYVKNTDYATSTKGGVVKVTNVSSGLTMNNGNLSISYANDTDIGLKQDTYRPLTSKYIDNIVAKGITTNTIPLTDQQKAKACEWLGVADLIGDIETLLGGI